MAKRINRADKLVFKALQKAIAEDKLHICLISSKINVPGSPVYNPWENLLPVFIPVMSGLFLIWLAGILWGLIFMTAGIVLSSHLVKKEMEQRLFNRAKSFLTSDYESCCTLWDFGGIVLVKADDKRQGCIAPEGNWREFVILNFSEFMTEKAPVQTVIEDTDEKAA